jgi:diguanylate cyclase (GGDEF)-like protein
MEFSSAAADATAFLIQESGALLFAAVFLFLWRQSRLPYFGLWSGAWLLRFAAALCGIQTLTSSGAWLAGYGLFESGFVIALIAAGSAGYESEDGALKRVKRLWWIAPVFVAAVYALSAFSRAEAYYVSEAVAAGLVYVYNFTALRRSYSFGQGPAGNVFRISLLVVAAALLEHAIVFVYLYQTGDPGRWMLYLHRETYYDFTLHCLLAFSAMAMWGEAQAARIRQLHAELDQTRHETRRSRDVDGLTGLQNQAALARRVSTGAQFAGVVAVCDMDNFKDVNDRFGHLVGDEILRNIGSLLHASIRHEDEAFRWGGDEFVILFSNQMPEIASKRMAEIEARLREFQVRGFGAQPIAMSWGAADAHGRALREALDEADRCMYAVKRTRSPDAARRA